MTQQIFLNIYLLLNAIFILFFNLISYFWHAKDDSNMRMQCLKL